jgi:hypothetical protein
METVDWSFDRLVRSVDYQLLAALSDWLTGIALPVGSATVRQVRYDPAPRTARNDGKLDQVRLCNDEEGTCMRRLNASWEFMLLVGRPGAGGSSYRAVKETEMRKVIVNEFISLDGVAQAPGGARARSSRRTQRPCEGRLPWPS